MKKQTIIILICLILLAAVIGIMLFLSRDTIADGREAQANQSISITENGETLATLYWDEITSLDSVTFEAVLRSSGARPKNTEYRGVELHTLMDAAGIDLTGRSLEFIGADAYASSVTVEEVTEEDQIYIVYEADGELLGTRADGGDGPYQLIIVVDHFSQRWCKYLSEVVIR